MSGAQFVEQNGLVHILSAGNREYTICGDAFDLGSATPSDGLTDAVATTKRVVTCPTCATIIVECRGVRVAPRTSRESEHDRN